jgi:two-component system, NtrC family, sensor kinase
MSNNTNWRILVIDDEPDVREVVALALADEGYTVDTAADGQAGVEQCRDFDPQIVITDIRMPRMDGIQVLEHLKQHHSDIEVIVVTAFADIPLAIRALQLDASDFVTKPLDHDALHMALKRAMERYASRKQLRDYMQLLERDKARTTRDLVHHINFQRNLIESSMDAILGCDITDRIILANPSMAKLVGIPKERLTNGMTMDALFSKSERVRLEQELDSEAAGGVNRLSLFETALFDAEKRQVPVHVSAVRLFQEEQMEGLVLFLRDLREFRRLERALTDQAHTLQQDKMVALGRLAASVVHELNNPMSGILNYVRLMRKGVREGLSDRVRLEKFGHYLELVEREISRCSLITANLLDFTRKSPPVLEAVPIQWIIERALLLCGHKLELQKIKQTVDIAPDLPQVEGDANQIQQCLINLIFNAMDAMPQGGYLMISARFDERRRQVVLRIQDTGSGIQEKDLPYVFDHFFTTKQQGYGVGLGLSTVHGIVKRHGGSVCVERTSEAGTTFRLELPVHGATPA